MKSIGLITYFSGLFCPGVELGFKNAIDIENYKILVFSLMIIPILLGMFWARKEQKYNNKNAADRYRAG
jgi:hypothetical protein